MKLHKRGIAEGGLAMLAEGGLKNLSTRKLASHFGVKSASLYYHFRNKQELLDHVADVMVAPAWRPARAGESWQDWLVDTASTLRALMLSYPDGALLYAGASPPPELLEERLQVLFAPTLEAGYNRAQSRYAMMTVIRFVIGCSVDEQVACSRGAGRPAETYQDDFAVGIRMVVRGIEAMLAEYHRRT